MRVESPSWPSGDYHMLEQSQLRYVNINAYANFGQIPFSQDIERKRKSESRND